MIAIHDIVFLSVAVLELITAALNDHKGRTILGWLGKAQDPHSVGRSLVYLYQLSLFGKIRKNGQSQHTHVIGLKFPVAGNQNNRLPPLTQLLNIY
jgi:hypothetical protein